MPNKLEPITTEANNFSYKKLKVVPQNSILKCSKPSSNIQ